VERKAATTSGSNCVPAPGANALNGVLDRDARAVGAGRGGVEEELGKAVEVDERDEGEAEREDAGEADRRVVPSGGAWERERQEPE
jgi:hypothetical protein